MVNLCIGLMYCPCVHRSIRMLLNRLMIFGVEHEQVRFHWQCMLFSRRALCSCVAICFPWSGHSRLEVGPSEVETAICCSDKRSYQGSMIGLATSWSQYLDKPIKATSYQLVGWRVSLSSTQNLDDWQVLSCLGWWPIPTLPIIRQWLKSWCNILALPLTICFILVDLGLLIGKQKLNQNIGYQNVW